MSQTVPSDSNLKDTDEQLSMQEAQSMQEDSQFFFAPQTKAKAPNMPPEFDEVEMLEEPKLVFPVPTGGKPPQADSSKFSPKLNYRQGGAWGDLSIRNKVAVLAAILGIVPSALLGLMNYGLQTRSLEQQLQNEALVSAKAVNEQLSLFMRERLGDIQVMAQSEIFTDAELRKESEPADMAKKLEQFSSSYQIYKGIGFFDLSGNLVAQSPGKPLGNVAEKVYFQDALSKGEPTISDPIVKRSTGVANIFVSAPVKDAKTNKTIGVVVARIPAIQLDQILTSAADKASLERGGDFAYHVYNLNNQAFSDSLKNSDQGSSAIDAPVGVSASMASQLPFLEEGATENRRGQSTSAADGKGFTGTFATAEVAGGYATFSDWDDGFRIGLPELGWKTVTTVEKTALSQERQRLLQGLILQVLASGGILALVAGLLATRATRPLVQAVNAVQKIGDGELSTRLPVKSKDELSILNKNLNQMAEQLQEFTTEQQAATSRASWLMGLAANADNLSQAEVNQRLAETATQIRKFLNADRMVIYRLEPVEQIVVDQESVDDAWPAAADLDLDQVKLAPAVLKALAQGESVAMSAIAEVTLPEGYAEMLEALNVQSELIVPLLEHNELSGLLVIHSCEQRRNWSETDINFVQQIAAQLSILQQIQEVQVARGLAELNAEQEKERIEELQRRVMQLLMEVDPVSRGDLTIRAKVTEDEIGTVADSYNATIESLRRIVSQVQGTVTQVVDTASGSGAAVLTLASGANQQTEEITDALGSIEQMALSIRQVATNAVQAEVAVQQATATVAQGDAAMDKTVEGIFAIRETVGEAAKKVKRLGESSQKISKVVNLISSFAEQTNLLALNASIEAAHAGEEGRGFAVVADEVRSLARQSAQATAEIEALVAEIQSETNQVSAAMESGTAQVVTGTQLVETARQNLTQIAQVSEQIRALVAEIAQATGQQTAASEQVSTVMKDVVGIANQTSESVDEVSTSLAALVGLAQSLDESVGQFKVQ